jgi:hypothetical protein
MANAKQSTELPLDDMQRWTPIAEIVGRLFPHIGNKSLIAQDLTEALASWKIRCMRRHTNEHMLKADPLSDAQLYAMAIGKVADEVGHHQPVGRELLSAAFWVEYCLVCSPNGDIRVGLRPPSRPTFTWTANWVFYLWEPDCVEVWPALTPQAVAAHEPEANKPLGRKPGPRPTKEWKLFIAHKLYVLHEAGKPTPSAGELAELCREELGYEPDESAIRLWLRELGRLLS